MADLVNLRTVRKRVQRRRDEERARANRLVHGEPPRIRKLADARRAQATRNLDAHRVEKGDGR